MPARLARGVGIMAGLLACGCAIAEPAAPRTETIDQAVCRMIESGAKASYLPVDFLTRLIWRESTFRVGAVSPAGALGIAQFMPRTAASRGLADPFDPEQAIPKAAEFLAELVMRFGNVGLAAAAYNGGPTRVANWLDGRGGLPDETRAFVMFITGRPAEEWAEAARASTYLETSRRKHGSCLELAVALRGPGRDRLYDPYDGPLDESPLAPWGVQVAGNFSKAVALASYARTRQRHAAILGDAAPMIIGTRFRSRGTRAFYRVRIPAPSRPAANTLCDKLRAAGGSCVVLKS